MNWISKQISEVFCDFVNSALNFFSSFIAGFFDRDVELFTSVEISGACSLTKAIAITLVILFSIKHIWDIFVTETDGDSESDPLQILVNASISLALIESNDIIFNMFQNISTKFSKDLGGSGSGTKFTVSASSLVAHIVDFDNATMMILLFVLLSILIVIIFSFIAGKRAAELVLLKVLFPVMAVDRMSAGQERWNAFLSTYVQTFFGYTLQLFLCKLGLARLAAGFNEGINAKYTSYFAGLCFFWVAISLPKWMDRFTYSSGVGQTTKTITNTVVRESLRRALR